MSLTPASTKLKLVARAIATRGHAEQASKDVRAELGATALAWAGSMPHSRVNSRSVAAASAEPPPSPDAIGRFFVRVSAAPCADARARPQCSRGREHEIVLGVAKLASERPDSLQA